jgi:hypothetical protein
LCHGQIGPDDIRKRQRFHLHEPDITPSSRSTNASSNAISFR